MVGEYRPWAPVLPLDCDRAGYQNGAQPIISMINDTSPALQAFISALVPLYVPEATFRASHCGYGCSDYGTFYSAGPIVIALQAHTSQIRGSFVGVGVTGGEQQVHRESQAGAHPGAPLPAPESLGVVGFGVAAASQHNRAARTEARGHAVGRRVRPSGDHPMLEELVRRTTPACRMLAPATLSSALIHT